MARMCQECGKKTAFGNSVARRGRAKYLGGVGVKTTGVTRRTFVPNLKKVRVRLANGTVTRMTLCTKCLRGGKFHKPSPRPKLEAKKA